MSDFEGIGDMLTAGTLIDGCKDIHGEVTISRHELASLEEASAILLHAETMGIYGDVSMDEH